MSIPPFQLQRLISNVVDSHQSASGRLQVRCAQALGSEIFVGCVNGDLLRFVLQADKPGKLDSYVQVSCKRIPGDAPIDEIVLIPSLSRALIFSDHQIHFYTVPSLDPLPIKPLRNVVAFAVDDHHLKRPATISNPAGVTIPLDPVDLCVIKRTGVALYTLKDRLMYQRELPLPQGGTLIAKRVGKSLCIADRTMYHMVDLQAMSIFQLLPVSQAVDPVPFEVKPSITVIGPNEFLILSWTGASTLGVFITGEGDAVRGTLEWSSHPEAICLDYPYITSLLPNNSIEVHYLETQAVVQAIGSSSTTSPVSRLPSPGKSPHRRQSSNASANSSRGSGGLELSRRMDLVSCVGGYLVPSTQRLEKMSRVPVKLLRS